jgi:sigma-B regulation protein RsbU (phosphoserine phosphatase)
LARRISQPITVLADATERIAKGDLEHRVTVTARDEVQSLVTGFNKMTEELQENKKNLISMAKREAQIARDFEIARQVQEGLFPTALPLVHGWEFAAICRAAKVVGGDYYDIFEISPGKVLFAQGDVSGKGVGASITMASVHAIIRSWGGAIQANLENLKDDPARLVAELNRYLVSSRTPEMFVTAFLGLLDCQTSELWYVNCGHPPAVILRSGDTRPEALTVGGMVLGVSERAPYSTGTCRIESGDALVLVSDGVTEATNPKGDLYGESMQAKTLASSRGLSALDAMQQLLSSVDGFMAGAEQTDDISILVIRRTT